MLEYWTDGIMEKQVSEKSLIDKIHLEKRLINE
jgi:hypothetical protein